MKRQLAERDTVPEDIKQLANEIVCKLDGAAPTLTSADFRNAKMIAKEIDAYVQEKATQARAGERTLCKTVFDILAEGTSGAARNSIWEEDRDLFDTFTAGIEKAVDRTRLEESEWWQECWKESEAVDETCVAVDERLAANRTKVKPADPPKGR